MRRHAYPYGRYLIENETIEALGPRLKAYLASFGFPIAKYKEGNEGSGILIVAVNKRIGEFLKQKKPPGHLRMVMRGFPIETPSMREMDTASQRIGIECYLWPLEEGVLFELFVLPYMSLFNAKEIFGLTESSTEEITDWYLCEQIWEELIPKLEADFPVAPIHKRC